MGHNPPLKVNIIADLEKSIRENYRLIQEYETLKDISVDPLEIRRANHFIEKRKPLLKELLARHLALCTKLGYQIPNDIVDVGADFSIFDVERHNPLGNHTSEITQKNIALYTQAILAIKDDMKVTVGTGFLAQYAKNTYILTCAHVVHAFGKKEGDKVNVKFFASKKDLQTEICWLRVPPNTNPNDWDAFEDIAVIKPVIASSSVRIPLTLRTKITSISEEYHCFAYVKTRRPRGVWIDHIRFGEKVDGGFIELEQQGKNVITHGASGSPVSDTHGMILGMIQAVYDKDRVAYLTPTEIILNVLESIEEEK
ncbi:MAG: trypsin-like peptidase domain-containing protein [Anaerolineae bacterium]|nr:trypsin-like peptidase domain-containing protein [Anaerolineae bacterium]